MKRFALPLIFVLILALGLWIFLPKSEPTDSGDSPSDQPPAVVTLVADQEGATPGVTILPGDGNGPPADLIDRPPGLMSFDSRQLMGALAALMALPDHERLKQIADYLDSPYAYERAIGAIAAFEEGILSEGMKVDLAADPDAFVPLQLMGWIRDGLDSENLSSLLEGFRQRDDYNIGALKAWVRDSETSAPAGRALLDMLEMEFSGDALQRELRQIAFTEMSKAANPDIRIEAVIRLAEGMDPVDYARQLQQVRRSLPEFKPLEPDPSLQPGSAEALADHRERVRQYQEKTFADQLQVQATRYNKPPQIIEAEGVLAGPAQFSAAWNLTGERELDFLASLVERAVVNQEPVQAGSVITVERILQEAPDRNPTAEFSNRQAYETRRLEASLSGLRVLEDSSAVIDVPPGAAPPGS